MRVSTVIKLLFWFVLRPIWNYAKNYGGNNYQESVKKYFAEIVPQWNLNHYLKLKYMQYFSLFTILSIGRKCILPRFTALVTTEASLG
jgi:hypothetical protein